MEDIATPLVFLLVYLFTLWFVMVENAPQWLGTEFGIRETIKRYKRLDEGVKRFIRLFISLFIGLCCSLIFAGIEWVVAGLFFVPFVVYTVIVFIYEYS